MTPLERRVLQRAAEHPAARLRMIAHDREEREALVRLVRAGLVRVAGDPLRIVGASLEGAGAAGAHTAPAPLPDDRREAIAAACRPLSAKPAPTPREGDSPPRKPRPLTACDECGRQVPVGSALSSHKRAHARRAEAARGDGED